MPYQPTLKETVSGSIQGLIKRRFEVCHIRFVVLVDQ